VLVYVGAVMVLFLFVVMMLDIHVDSLRTGFWKHFPLAGLIGALIALEMAAVLMGGFRVGEGARAAAAAAAPLPADYSNTKELGKLLYTQYLFPLEIAALILLVAIVAAIALTLRTRKDSRHMDPSVQVRVKAADRLQVVKLDPTRAAPASGPAPDTTPGASS
jgi:NADH-quinone oxidoreductase subunit J